MNRRLRRRRVRHYQRMGQPWQTLGAINPASADQDWQTFDAHLTQLETSIQVLRERFEQIQTWQAQQQQIEQQLQQPGLRAEEVSQLQQRLEELEMQLETNLFDWRSLYEPFWQAVRFGGLGIIIGWILHVIVSR